MICNDNSFKDFQNILRILKYDNIPEEPIHCSWKINSYDFFQNYLKRCLISPDVLEIISKFIPIEKYYWTTVTLFPCNHFGYERDDTIVSIQDLTNEENKIFKKQMENMVKTVYENQKALGYNLEENYLDVCENILTRMF